MVASPKLKKAFQSGIKKSYSVIHEIAQGITEVVSSLKKQRPNYILKIPRGKSIGKVYYTVESSLDPITYAKRKDAESLRRALKLAVNPIQADIIRREITEEGYIPTYPKE